MIRLLYLPVVTILLGFSLNSGLPEPEPLSSDTYPEHLTGAFTGGFGEQTCRSCHFDYDLNPDGGSLSVSGIPETISAGKKLNIEIAVERENLGRAGFQLSARYPDGRQAGTFEIDGNSRVMFSEAVPDSLRYVQHSSEGTQPEQDGKQSWQIVWRAPDTLTGPVIFNIAANAANGDQSEFGDFIYTEEVKANF